MNANIQYYYEYLLNKEIYKICIPIILFLCTYYALNFIQDRLVRNIKKKNTLLSFWPNAMVESLLSVKKIFLLAFSVFFSLLWIDIPLHFKPMITKSFTVIILLQLGQVAVLVSRMWLTSQINQGQDKERATTINLISIIVRVAIYSLVFLLILNNLGVDITALIAGFGIGGIAIALAVQNILSDLFSSLTIILDKPFKVGDLIFVGDFNGTVEHIGLKTTRLQSVSGEQLILGNGDLLQSRIKNFQAMKERRILQKLTVVYQTPAETLESIPQWIEELVKCESNTRFERCHFLAFLDSALEFELIYWVLTPNLKDYADVAHKINLAIFRKFALEKVEFAYPTQTLFTKKLL